MHILEGGVGDDWIWGADGNDTIGGDLLGGSGDVGGNDQLIGNGGNDTMTGGAGDDFMEGGDGDDDMFGNEDDDKMKGGAGIDAMYGGYGDDKMFGGDGDDNMWGDDKRFEEYGKDEMWGGAGDDSMYGGALDDKMHGGTGDDLILGDGGEDTIWGDEGEDEIYSGTGWDTIFGGPGCDTIFTEDGGDVVWLGACEEKNPQQVYIFGTGRDPENFTVVMDFWQQPAKRYNEICVAPSYRQKLPNIEDDSGFKEGDNFTVWNTCRLIRDRLGSGLEDDFGIDLCLNAIDIMSPLDGPTFSNNPEKVQGAGCKHDGGPLWISIPIVDLHLKRDSSSDHIIKHFNNGIGNNNWNAAAQTESVINIIGNGNGNGNSHQRCDGPENDAGFFFLDDDPMCGWDCHPEHIVARFFQKNPYKNQEKQRDIKHNSHHNSKHDKHGKKDNWHSGHDDHFKSRSRYEEQHHYDHGYSSEEDLVECLAVHICTTCDTTVTVDPCSV